MADMANDDWGDVEAFLAAETERLQKAGINPDQPRRNKSEYKYSERLAFQGPTLMRIVRATMVEMPGGLGVEIFAEVEDPTLPDTEQGKVLIEKVPYGSAPIKNGFRDEMFFKLLLACGWSNAELATIKSRSRAEVISTLVGCLVGAVYVCTDEGYQNVKYWVTQNRHARMVETDPVRKPMPPRAKKANGVIATPSPVSEAAVPDNY